jgi:hypothetical protein
MGNDHDAAGDGGVLLEMAERPGKGRRQGDWFEARQPFYLLISK